MTDLERQELLDEEHLRLLRLGYLLTGANGAVFVLLPLTLVALGVYVLTAAPDVAVEGDFTPALSAWLCIVIGTLASIFMVVASVLKLMTARALRLRRARTLCLVTATITCLAMPYGAVLGMWTFTVLGRPTVAAQFAARPVGDATARSGS